MNYILSLTSFNGQNIRQVTDSDGNIWMSLNDCVKAGGRLRRQFLPELLKSDSYKEYVEALWRSKNRSPLESIIKVVKSTEETEIFTQGTYLNVSSKSGRSLLLYVAQRISPEFHLWCNDHIENILKDGYSIQPEILCQKEESIKKLARDLKKMQKRYNTLAINHNKLLDGGVYNETHLSMLLTRLFSIVGRKYTSEDAYCLESGRVVRFDLLRKQGRLIDIIELKNKPITYRVIAEDLLIKKKYLNAVQELFPERVVKFTFLGTDTPIGKEDLLSLQEELPPHIQLTVQNLDNEYFKDLYQSFLLRKLSDGVLFHQVYPQWERSEAPGIISKISSFTDVLTDKIS